MEKDIRWQQRFSNYKRALQQLGEAVVLSESRELSNLEKQGVIQAFEYTQISLNTRDRKIFTVPGMLPGWPSS